jgi:hypothetical protein
MIDFEGYAGDCRIHARLEIGTNRLTDVLNSTSELRIVDARLESLADGHGVELPELVLEHDELCAVVAAGPRGDAARRLRTRATRVVIELDPYRIEGNIHGTPASDPIGLVLRRAAWIPLTDVTIGYTFAGEAVREAIETLLVNRVKAASIRSVTEEMPLLPGETPRARPPVTAGTLDLTRAFRAEAGGEDEAVGDDESKPGAPGPVT